MAATHGVTLDWQPPSAPAIHGGFLSFPDTFVFGGATAAYQIEGAAAEGGRKPSIWDTYAHSPGITTDSATGDVACDHYHRWRDDIRLMKILGLQAYRFSISWSRLIPDGIGDVNEEGAKFYSDLIDALLAEGIEPYVTIYHWDLPQALEDAFGGWLDPSKEQIKSAYAGFAKECFSRYGSRVKCWTTFNEPRCSSEYGYGNGSQAPGRTCSPATEPYLAAHNILLCHAEAVRIYRTEFAQMQGGRIGIVLNTRWVQPKDPSSAEDRQMAQRGMDFMLGWFADPVFFGDYPESMRKNCGERLPKFTETEQNNLRGSCDFLGLNYYNACIADGKTATPWAPEDSRSFGADMNLKFMNDPHWEATCMGWNIVPWALRELLLYSHNRYKPQAGIIITENGCACHEGEETGHPQPYVDGSINEDFEHETYDDPDRVRFVKHHLTAVHAAITAGADVRGYMYWSLMDNFEWKAGYIPRFGIVRIDYNTQKRTVKQSGRFFAEASKNHGFEAPYLNDQYGGIHFGSKGPIVNTSSEPSTTTPHASMSNVTGT